MTTGILNQADWRRLKHHYRVKRCEREGHAPKPHGMVRTFWICEKCGEVLSRSRYD